MSEAPGEELGRHQTRIREECLGESNRGPWREMEMMNGIDYGVEK